MNLPAYHVSIVPCVVYMLDPCCHLMQNPMLELESLSASPECCTLDNLSTVSKLRLSISAHSTSSKGKTWEQFAPALVSFLQD